MKNVYFKCVLTCLALLCFCACGIVPVKTSPIRQKKAQSKETLAKPEQESSKPRPEENAVETGIQANDLDKVCARQLAELPGPFDSDKVFQLCQKVEQINDCTSHQGREIFHFDKNGSKANGRRILALGVVHGDELPGGSVARSWMTRLLDLDPRNSWRVVPVVNPDGKAKNTRTNARGVDINRNFPTKDWTQKALDYWRTRAKSKKRKYPGPGPASEAETMCVINHIQDFKPDLIVAIHTPLGVLDFDGPPLKFPKFKGLPWISLGNFPGSLGRYMWVDHKTPVLTIELKGNNAIRHLSKLDQLQDITGIVAIWSKSYLAKESKKGHKGF